MVNPGLYNLLCITTKNTIAESLDAERAPVSKHTNYVFC